MSLELVTGPTEEPVELEDVKLFLKEDETADDALIDSLRCAARSFAETWRSEIFLEQQWKLRLDRFPSDSDVIEIPLHPLKSIDSITYLDTDGVSQTFSSSLYTADLNARPGFVHLNYNEVWPDTRDIQNAVTVTFKAGYASVDAVPEEIKLAIKHLVLLWKEDRGPEYFNRDDVPLHIRTLLDHDRYHSFA